MLCQIGSWVFCLSVSVLANKTLGTLVRVTAFLNEAVVRAVIKLFVCFLTCLQHDKKCVYCTHMVFFSFFQGARVNAKDNKWLTPLHRAVASCSEVTQKCFLLLATDTQLSFFVPS